LRRVSSGIEQGYGVPARSGGGEKVAGIVAEAAAHAGKSDGRRSKNRPQAGQLDHHQVVPRQLRYAGSNRLG
jgi:hypothetical protein